MAVAYTDKIKAEILADIERQNNAMTSKGGYVLLRDILNQRYDDIAKQPVPPPQEYEDCKNQDEAFSWIEKRLAETFGNNVSLSLDSQTGQLTADAAEGTSVLLQPEDWSEGGLTKIERFTSGGAGTVTVTAPVQVNVRPATESPKCLGPKSVQTKSRQSPVGFKHPSTKHKLDDGLSLWGYMGRRK